jgi:hypothetical protein
MVGCMMNSRFKSDSQRKAVFANLKDMFPKDMFSHLKDVAPKAISKSEFSGRPFRPDIQDLIEDNYGARSIGIGPGQGIGEFSKKNKQ